MILIAVGANLPSPGKTVLQNCEAAVAAVRALPGMNFVALSTWYRSAPIPNSDQPDYCNGVIRLDLIDLNGVVRTDPSPILPHPRAHTRAFVLRPILDVAPGWRHPTKRASVVTLFAELPQQEIQPWAD